jgi:hypothetical protein
VRAQGVESFDRACVACHEKLGPHTSLSVEHVTGEAARSERGCVDCHVRRSQPFDLPHVRTADHFIRRRIERPQHDIPHRQFAAREAGLTIFDAGRRWSAGVMAMGLLTMGRFVAELAENGGQTERARQARERMRALSPSTRVNERF